MRNILLLLLLITISLSAQSQDHRKMTFTINDCTYSTNDKDYKPFPENLKNRFVVFDLYEKKWIFYTKKTRIYKIMKMERSDTELNPSLKKITFQVIDEKNNPLVLVFLYSTNDEGSSLYMLFQIEGERTLKYHLNLFNLGE